MLLIISVVSFIRFIDRLPIPQQHARSYPLEWLGTYFNTNSQTHEKFDCHLCYVACVTFFPSQTELQKGMSSQIWQIIFEVSTPQNRIFPLWFSRLRSQHTALHTAFILTSCSLRDLVLSMLADCQILIRATISSILQGSLQG